MLRGADSKTEEAGTVGHQVLGRSSVVRLKRSQTIEAFAAPAKTFCEQRRLFPRTLGSATSM